MTTVNEQKEIPESPPGEVATKRLTGNLTTSGIVFTVLAFNAPLTVFVGLIPFIIGSGNQLGTPVTYLAACALVLCFAVGFTSMGRRLSNPGAFYAYITAGLGKPLGLGASFLALLAYFFFLAGAFAFGGVSLESLVTDVFSGPDIQWWVYTFVLIAIVGVLGYVEISLSAKILTVFMIFEVVIIVAFDVASFVNGGPEGVSAAPFLLSNIFSGNVGLAALLGVMCYAGFEATAVFREEARNPERTIPRATYISILSMGSMYAISAWALITGVGASSVVAASAEDPSGTATGAVALYLGKIAFDVVLALVCTSIFAAMIATHNISARYMYSLSMDHVFHASLRRIHVKHGSPHVASLATSLVALVFIAVLAIAGVDGTSLFGILEGIAAYPLILLMLLTSVAVIVYFRRNPQYQVGVWRSLLAPGLAAIGFAVVAVIGTQNIALLIGGNEVLAGILLTLFYGSLIAGIALALIYRRKNPGVYARIGRQGA
ncbi:APC family permease [Arthrobacter sp. NtRootA1]|uniref:APC family permease n=1 Tax=Micrococcaceae TaxID=1268 RepID=UPI001CC46047|nr:APC family permease [Arthrobacter sp. NtRootA1]BCW05769.1 amino acid transporter [Arthrobacter sp. NtRootA1]